METQAPLYAPASIRPDSLHALVRNVLRQPTATSDTLLILADALTEVEGSAQARSLASTLRDLAPVYATRRPTPDAPPDHARALIRQHPIRSTRIRQLVNDIPIILEPSERALLSALARAADLEEGHSA